MPTTHLNIHYHYLLTLNVAPDDACAANLRYTTLFGRASVPVSSLVGKTPSPVMNATQMQHYKDVQRQTALSLQQHGKATGLASAPTHDTPGSFYVPTNDTPVVSLLKAPSVKKVRAAAKPLHVNKVHSR